RRREQPLEGPQRVVAELLGAPRDVDHVLRGRPRTRDGQAETDPHPTDPTGPAVGTPGPPPGRRAHRCPGPVTGSGWTAAGQSAESAEAAEAAESAGESAVASTGESAVASTGESAVASTGESAVASAGESVGESATEPPSLPPLSAVSCVTSPRSCRSTPPAPSSAATA